MSAQPNPIDVPQTPEAEAPQVPQVPVAATEANEKHVLREFIDEGELPHPLTDEDWRCTWCLRCRHQFMDRCQKSYSEDPRSLEFRNGSKSCCKPCFRLQCMTIPGHQRAGQLKAMQKTTANRTKWQKDVFTSEDDRREAQESSGKRGRVSATRLGVSSCLAKRQSDQFEVVQTKYGWPIEFWESHHEKTHNPKATQTCRIDGKLKKVIVETYGEEFKRFGVVELLNRSINAVDRVHNVLDNERAANVAVFEAEHKHLLARNSCNWTTVKDEGGNDTSTLAAQPGGNKRKLDKEEAAMLGEFAALEAGFDVQGIARGALKPQKGDGCDSESDSSSYSSSEESSENSNLTTTTTKAKKSKKKHKKHEKKQKKQQKRDANKANKLAKREKTKAAMQAKKDALAAKKVLKATGSQSIEVSLEEDPWLPLKSAQRVAVSCHLKEDLLKQLKDETALQKLAAQLDKERERIISGELGRLCDVVAAGSTEAHIAKLTGLEKPEELLKVDTVTCIEAISIAQRTATYCEHMSTALQMCFPAKGKAVAPPDAILHHLRSCCGYPVPMKCWLIPLNSYVEALVGQAQSTRADVGLLLGWLLSLKRPDESTASYALEWFGTSEITARITPPCLWDLAGVEKGVVEDEHTELVMKALQLLWKQGQVESLDESLTMLARHTLAFVNTLTPWPGQLQATVRSAHLVMRAGLKDKVAVEVDCEPGLVSSACDHVVSAEHNVQLHRCFTSTHPCLKAAVQNCKKWLTFVDGDEDRSKSLDGTLHTLTCLEVPSLSPSGVAAKDIGKAIDQFSKPLQEIHRIQCASSSMLRRRRAGAFEEADMLREKLSHIIFQNCHNFFREMVLNAVGRKFVKSTDLLVSDLGNILGSLKEQLGTSKSTKLSTLCRHPQQCTEFDDRVSALYELANELKIGFQLVSDKKIPHDNIELTDIVTSISTLFEEKYCVIIPTSLFESRLGFPGEEFLNTMQQFWSLLTPKVNAAMRSVFGEDSARQLLCYLTVGSWQAMLPEKILADMEPEQMKKLAGDLQDLSKRYSSSLREITVYAHCKRKDQKKPSAATYPMSSFELVAVLIGVAGLHRSVAGLHFVESVSGCHELIKPFLDGLRLHREKLFEITHGQCPVTAAGFNADNLIFAVHDFQKKEVMVVNSLVDHFRQMCETMFRKAASVLSKNAGKDSESTVECSAFAWRSLSRDEAMRLIASKHASEVLDKYHKANDRYKKCRAVLMDVFARNYELGANWCGRKFSFDVGDLDGGDVAELRNRCARFVAVCTVIEANSCIVRAGMSRKKLFEETFAYLQDPGQPRICLPDDVKELMNEQVVWPF